MLVEVLLLVVLLFLFYFMFLREKGGVEKEIERKMKKGMELQRNGKLKEYGELMREIEELEKR